ncbi:MAG: UpxY family transcription antiterminator [Saprospiraceae bacterium]|nr:UpxY family transcription antiterminator [Candidatus Vicinibacter affinis]
MPIWRVLYIQSRYEFKVEQQMEKLGIRHFLPKINIKRVWSDRIKNIKIPAFPSYIFVYNEDKDRNAVFKSKELNITCGMTIGMRYWMKKK